jgi:hypothetical protein
MTLIQQILDIYPELTNEDFVFNKGIIALRDDSDGHGEYIEKWEYSNPIPEGLKLGK